MRAFLFRAVIIFSIFFLNAGCAGKSLRSDERPISAKSSLAVSAEKNSIDLIPDRMMVWKAYLGLEVSDVGSVINKITALTVQSGGYIESKSESTEKTADLRLRIPVQKFKEMIGSLESLGTVDFRRINREDVTEQYIDVEARLKNKIALRDRLKQLLEKASNVKDILSIESELSRVQSDIDSMEGKIKSLKGQVDLATLDVSLKRKPILGPLGYIFKGLWWGVKKLFVVRD